MKSHTLCNCENPTHENPTWRTLFIIKFSGSNFPFPKLPLLLYKYPSILACVLESAQSLPCLKHWSATISFFWINSFFSFFIVVQVQLSPFSCHHSPLPLPPPPPTLNPTHLWLYPCVLYTCSLMILSQLSPVISHLAPLWLLSVYSLFQCL